MVILNLKMIHVCMSNKHNEIDPGATAETSVEPQAKKGSKGKKGKK